MNQERGLWYSAEFHSMILIVASGLGILFLLGRGALSEDYFIVYWVSAFCIFIVMTLIFSVKVECDDENLYISYGIGLFQREFPLYSIAEAGPVGNESLFTMPYNPLGEGAIKIVLRSGKKFILPAERPKDFAQALLARAYRG